MSMIHHYDAFLSFRGPDTRQGLTDCLYNFMSDAGIRVFRDDDELSVGEPIDTILLAIRNSKVCLPVLSPTFASSSWCLREVAMMVELKKEIIPIFVGVTPDDVKLRSSVYGDDMVKHETKYGKEKVKQWEDALKHIVTIKGRELKDKGYWKFSEELTKEILDKLETNMKYVQNYIVGVDDQVENVLKLLDVESGGIRCVGIHGMGGVGKTTLAKVIFNKLLATFDSCCFLPDIRESSRRVNSIENMQKELLCKLDGKLKGIIDKIDLTEMIMKKFYNEKVLIVLDDVDKNEQICKLVGETNGFASGSRIIVTTRDAQVLHIGMKSFDGISKVEGMTFRHGIQLFSHHAFGMDSPPEDFESLSKEVVMSCKGLPLALEVSGSYLRQKDTMKWSETLKKLEKGPHRTVLDVLKMSYEALEDEQQQIFLDIACFFINSDKSYVSYMWEACGFSPILSLDVLVSMSLIKIVDNDKLWMHDHLRDLGREIVREEGRRNLRSCSRLWEHCEDMMDILKYKEGNEGLVGLRLEGPCPSPMDEVLAGSHNLRFLSLEQTKFRKKFKYPLPQLKWLSMRQCPSSFSASHLNIRNLAILEMHDSSINTKWEGWNCIKMPNLKVLDLTNCTKLTCTPDFSRMPKLERLTLRRCTNLVKLHHSIITLGNLKYLDLNYCSSLRKLLEEIGCLENLEEMYVHGCTKLKNFPSSLGKLKSLVALDLSGKPDSFDRWFSMGDFLQGCDVDLSLLSSFLDQSIIGQTIFTAKLLKDFWLLGEHNGLQLPDIFGGLQSLTKLDLSYLSVSSLPESIGYLENLVELKAKRSLLVSLPKSIGRLKMLETLDLATSPRLEEIPEEIGDLSNLRTLNLSRTGIKLLPSTITQLSLLQSLYLAGCSELGQHQDGSTSATNQPATESSEQVQPAANALPTGFGDFPQLEILELSCTHLECIPSLPSSLRHLILVDLNQGVKLPDTSNNINLKYLFISFSGEGSKVENLESLPLRELRVTDADDLPDLSNLKNLRKLVVMGGELEAIPGLAKLESLEELDICGCESLDSLENLSELKNLKYLSIFGCPKLRVVEGLDRSNLLQKQVHLSDCGCTKCVATKRPSWRRRLLSWVKDEMGLLNLDELSSSVHHLLENKILMVLED